MSQRYLAPIKTNAAPPPGWVPSDKAGLIAWFRADTVSVDGGNNVTSWTDQSGNAYNATPTGTAPKKVNSVINGNPVIRFVAADNGRLTFASGISLLDKDTANTVVFITKATAQLTGGSFGVFLGLGTSSTTRTSFFNAETATYGQLNAGGGTAGTDTNVGLTTFNYYSAFYSLISQYNGGGSFSTAANYSWLTNGSTNNPTNFAGAVNTTTGENCIGAFGPSALNYDGDIAEIIVWNSTLSGGDQTSLLSYISSRYGI